MDTSVNLDYYRKIVQTYIERQQYSSALFWADKVAAFSQNDAGDLYWLAKTMMLSGQYHRAAHLIKSRKLQKVDLKCRHLAAKCMLEVKDYGEALDLLDVSEDMSVKSRSEVSDIPEETEDPNITSALLCLKGHVYEAMSNRSLAADCFREALQYDVNCFEAFEALVQHQMLTLDEEKELLRTLPKSSKSTALARFLYEDKLKKYGKPAKTVIPTSFDMLKYNSDFLVNQAERHYYNCEYDESCRITRKVLKKDPFHSSCLPLHVSCLVEKKQSNELFQLAHQLVDLYPATAFAWFAVGCYYLLVGKHDAARIHLSKSTAIDKLFGPAWLAYGHSFAVENEHDQAMAAYFKASHLMQGCHLPLLYIGLECGLTNNLKLAEKFFQQALEIAPEDPFVLHEMGVIAYQNEDYEDAEQHFQQALAQLKSVRQMTLTEKWEPLLNNLGNVSRKLRKYEDALQYHEQALVLVPLSPSTYSSIGFAHAMMGNLEAAVDAFHKALGLKRNDIFSTTMLNSVIEQLTEDTPPFTGSADDTPDTSGLQHSGSTSRDASKTSDSSPDVCQLNLKSVSDSPTEQ